MPDQGAWHRAQESREETLSMRQARGEQGAHSLRLHGESDTQRRPAQPIGLARTPQHVDGVARVPGKPQVEVAGTISCEPPERDVEDRKRTRLNSSHV